MSGDDPLTSTVTTPGVDTLLGSVVGGRFRVVEPVARGGMGRVYRAVQTPLNRPVALKVLDTKMGAGTDVQFRQRFLVEAALTAKLSHPNTVTVLDYGATEDGLFYIAMEYLDGRTLDEVVMAEGPLSWPRALSIGQQICRSLREAHQLGVVHRDLKPANVMLLNADEDQDLVKVLDFGLVKSFVQGQELEGRAVTQQGMLMGSPPYMAPEQGEHNRADPRSDIYSLGTVLYEALTGKPPFSGKNPLEVILKHVNEPVPPLLTPPNREEIPPQLVALVLKCLAKSPMDRFQTMDEVLHAFAEIANPGRYLTPATGIAVTNVVATEPQLKKAIPAILFLLAVTIGAGVAWVGIKALRHETTPAVRELPVDPVVEPVAVPVAVPEARPAPTPLPQRPSVAEKPAPEVKPAPRPAADVKPAPEAKPSPRPVAEVKPKPAPAPAKVAKPAPPPPAPKKHRASATRLGAKRSTGPATKLGDDDDGDPSDDALKRP